MSLTQLSDLQGWDNAIAQAFNIRAIPLPPSAFIPQVSSFFHRMMAEQRSYT